MIAEKYSQISGDTAGQGTEATIDRNIRTGSYSTSVNYYFVDVVTAIEPATDQREGADSARSTVEDRGVTATDPAAQTAGQCMMS